MAGQQNPLHKLINTARKKITIRQLRWALGRPVFDISPALRRHYSVATRHIDIADTGDVVHADNTKNRIDLSPRLMAYFERFQTASGIAIEDESLVLPHRFFIHRLRPCAQLAHTGALIDIATGRAIDLSASAAFAGDSTAAIRNHFRPRHFRRIVPVEGPALSIVAERHFAHFILGRFRRLLAALEAMPALQAGTLVFSTGLPSYQRAVLDQLALRFPRLKYLEVTPDIRLEFDALHVPSEPKDHNLTWFARGDFLAAVRDIYRDAYGLAGPNPHPAGPSRIYLSRNRQKLRRVLNEDEVASWLNEHGFDLVYPELLPHRDQAVLLQGATDVIAPSGSAITNILFCQPGTRFVLTGPVDMHKPFWAGLVLSLGLNFTFVPGSPAGVRNSFSVDPSNLERGMNEAFARE